MKTLKPIVLITALLCFNSAYADVAGADVKILSSMYAKMIEQIKVMRDELDQMKFLSESAKQTTEIMGAVQEEYHWINNFNLENEINGIVQDFTNLTYIDELAGAKDPETKYDLIRAEIDRRFSDEEKSTGTTISDEEKEALEKRLRALEAYEKMRDKYLSESLKPTGESDKDIQSNIASSTSMLAALALEDRIRQKEQELLEKEKLMDQIRWDSEFTSYLKQQ